MKTIMPKQVQTSDRKWYIIDATGLTLGRLATKIATTIRGKNKADFAPHVDNGDYVIVINCDKFVVSGNKMVDKMYHKHSGYLGGLTSTPLEKILVKKPGKPIESAVSGMLPKNKLRKAMMMRLKTFTGSEHPYTAQKPTELKI